MHGTPLKLDNTPFKDALDVLLKDALDNPLFMPVGFSSERVGLGSFSQACFSLGLLPCSRLSTCLLIVAGVPQATPTLVHDSMKDDTLTWSRRIKYKASEFGKHYILCCCEQVLCAWFTRAACVRQGARWQFERHRDALSSCSRRSRLLPPWT